MAKFRKKPIEIEAVSVHEALNAAGADWDALPSWLKDAYESGEHGGVVFARDHVLIGTMEGTMRGDIDDMIIRGVKGELYPCKPDIFAATYEAVTEWPGGRAPKNNPRRTENMDDIEPRDGTITSTASAASKLHDLMVVGDPDVWFIIAKAASKAGGFLHVTKAMNVPYGVIVDIYSETAAGASRSSLLVPGAQVVADRSIPGVNQGHIIPLAPSKPYDPSDFTG